MQQDYSKKENVNIRKSNGGKKCEVQGRTYLMGAKSFTLLQYSPKSAAFLICMDNDPDSPMPAHGAGYELPFEDLKRFLACVQKIVDSIEKGDGGHYENQL